MLSSIVYIQKTLTICIFINVLFLVCLKFSKLFQRHCNEKSLRTTGIYHNRKYCQLYLKYNNNINCKSIFLLLCGFAGKKHIQCLAALGDYAMFYHHLIKQAET